MKKLIWTALFVSMTASMMIGCGSESDPNSANDSYYGYGNNPYDRRNNYYGNVYHNPNQVILAGRVEITDPGAYKNYLKGVGACLSFWSETCSWVDDNPLLRISVDDYKFSDSDSSRGNVELITQSGPAPYPVRWRKINNNTGFDTKVFGPATTKSWNKPLQISITGRSTDATVKADLMYNGRVMGFAYLDRLNR